MFIALFHVLDYIDQFKAIKENLLRQVGQVLQVSQEKENIFLPR